MRTSSNLSTFHIGERIPLLLDFTAPAGAQLALLMATYDRSGRVSYESFDVSPSSGTIDPLAAYFNSGSFIGGGLSSSPSVLSPTPTTMHLDLNEWVRFDQPGDYTVTVHSFRVLSLGNPIFADREHPTVSNPLRLHILPATPQWQKSVLASALQALTAKPIPFAPLSPQATAAIADIRFLGSADAVPVLAAGLSDDHPDRAAPFALGLIGLPPSLDELAINTLRQRVDDPDVSVSGWLLTALSALQATSTKAPSEVFAARSAAHQEAVRLVLAALPRKVGKAKAATADFLLREDTGSLTASDQATIAQSLASTFTELPEQNQAILLDWHWDLLRFAITPQTLEQMASLPVKNVGSREMTTCNRVELKSTALHRWYQLDPEAATQAVYAQIGSAMPSLTAARLWFLPSEPLPHFEALWAQALLHPGTEKDPEVLAGLMTRFGTGVFAAQIAAKAHTSLDDEACAPQAAMVAYVVKFDSDLAAQLLHDVLHARSHTGCYRSIFSDVSRYTTSVALMDVAIDTISDADPQTAVDALRYLSVYGDKRSEQIIHKRYLSWSEEWAGKANELQALTPLTPSPNWTESMLGEALGQSLLVNQGWIADDQLRTEVLQRCVGDQMCHTLQQLAGTARSPYAVNLFQSDGQESIHVGPYQIPTLTLLQAKLSQYPPGTDFVLTSTDLSSDDQLFKQRVQAAFEKAGMTLTIQPGIK